MKQVAIAEAAQLIWANLCDGMQINARLPSCHPANRAEGFAAHSEIARLSGQTCVGWNTPAKRSPSLCATSHRQHRTTGLR